MDYIFLSICASGKLGSTVNNRDSFTVAERLLQRLYEMQFKMNSQRQLHKFLIDQVTFNFSDLFLALLFCFN
jgi:hypothetical protein